MVLPARERAPGPEKFDALLAHVEALEQALDTAKKLGEFMQGQRADARRYRWLRAQYRLMSPHMDSQHHWAPKMAAILKGPSVDAAIDAALSAQAKPQAGDAAGRKDGDSAGKEPTMPSGARMSVQAGIAPAQRNKCPHGTPYRYPCDEC